MQSCRLLLRRPLSSRSGLAFEDVEKGLAWIERHQQEECSEAYAVLLRRCASAEECKRIQEHIDRNGYFANSFLGTLQVQMLSRYGCLDEARAVFDRMRKRSSYSYNFMIGAYLQKGMHQEALAVYRKMGIDPDCCIFSNVLRACAALGPQALEDGRKAHEHIKRIWLKTDAYVDTALINMYSRCGSLKDAKLVFEDVKWNRDIHIWNSMLTAFLQHGEWEQAMELYRSMKAESMEPNAVTYATIFTVCSNSGDLEQGREMHSRLQESRLRMELPLQNSLINMYAKCDCIEEALKVFHEMEKRNVVSWTGMISAYTRKGASEQAFKLYEQMKTEGIEPNVVTFTIMLGACLSIDQRRTIDADMTKQEQKRSRPETTALMNERKEANDAEG